MMGKVWREWKYLALVKNETVVRIDLQLLLERLDRLTGLLHDVEPFPEITINLLDYKIVYGISPDFGEYIHVSADDKVVLRLTNEDIEKIRNIHA